MWCYTYAVHFKLFYLQGLVGANVGAMRCLHGAIELDKIIMHSPISYCVGVSFLCLPLFSLVALYEAQTQVLSAATHCQPDALLQADLQNECATCVETYMP